MEILEDQLKKVLLQIEKVLLQMEEGALQMIREQDRLGRGRHRLELEFLEVGEVSEPLIKRIYLITLIWIYYSEWPKTKNGICFRFGANLPLLSGQKRRKSRQEPDGSWTSLYPMASMTMGAS